MHTRTLLGLLRHGAAGRITRGADWEYRCPGSADPVTDDVYALAEQLLLDLHADGRVSITVAGRRRVAEDNALEAEVNAQPSPTPVVFSDEPEEQAARRAALVEALAGAPVGASTTELTRIAEALADTRKRLRESQLVSTAHLRHANDLRVQLDGQRSEVQRLEDELAALTCRCQLAPRVTATNDPRDLVTAITNERIATA